MDIPQILQFVDETVYAKTEKHLNDLQRRIIAGILKGKRYADVSETYGYSAQHVKKASHELLQMLSDIFGEQVKKNNFESVLERQINQKIKFGNNNTFHTIQNNKISYINGCPSPDSPTVDRGNNKTNIEIINKLRKFGLSDEKIAEALDISLDVVNQVEISGETD
ncbi:hypothetical protein ACE1CD_08530 [Aerosakkonema sp. BLCC-F183]|uniref:hypothetical protein n=1 Tax=Aerosakkonema sp. BLCC-F183 TaxID=3342834 RepID=UPI0035B79088